MILAIDPGKHACGCALFDAKGTLLRADLVRLPKAEGLGHARDLAAGVRQFFPLSSIADDLVIEQQAVILRGQTRGKDPNDLLRLAEVVGAIVASFPGVPVRGVLPREWKGTVDPDVMTRRIESKLQANEVPRIAGVIPSLRHNVIDAVGLGLWWLSKKGLR